MGALGKAAARPGHTRFGVDDDSRQLNQAICYRRRQSQRSPSRIAARIGNDPFSENILTEQLRQAVNRLFMELLVLIGSAVPFLIFFLAVQPEIRAQVNKRLAFLVTGFGQLLGKPMRQSGEYHVAFVHHLAGGFTNHIAQIEVGGIYLTDCLSLKADGADGRNLRLRMAQQQPHQLRAGVAGGSDNSRMYHK